MRWMKFKVASVRFFADRRPTLCQSKGKIKLEHYFQKKSLERLETFIMLFVSSYSSIYKRGLWPSSALSWFEWGLEI